MVMIMCNSLYECYETKHRRRAEYWISQGRPDYAAGSIRKAAKWQTKRRAFEYEIYGPYPKNCIDSLMDEWRKDHARKVAEQWNDAIFGVGTF